jgi:Uma2 family endonuclease
LENSREANGKIEMIATDTQPLTFAEFLVWNHETEGDFELIHGIPMPISEPTANHEDRVDALCELLLNYCRELNLPYVPKRSKQVKLKTELGEKEKSRKADIVVFAKDEWLRLKASPSPAAAYVPPPMVIEVVSTNWRDDYLTKLAEYESLGILEYWIADYAAQGAVRYIGSPKQPTLSVYQLMDGEYQVNQFRQNQRIESPTFPALNLTVDRILEFGA